MDDLNVQFGEWRTTIAKARRSGAGIRDIARWAGGSDATVDRVLHALPNERAITADRVLRAAADCDYSSASQLARLSRPNRKRWTVLLPGSADPFVRGVNDALRKWVQIRDPGGAHPQLSAGFYESRVLARALRRLGLKTDAIAFSGVDHHHARDEANALVDQGKLVLILISDITGGRHRGCIGIDNLAAGRTAAFLLASTAPPEGGKLAVIAATRQFRAQGERELGFQDIIQRKYPALSLAGTI